MIRIQKMEKLRPMPTGLFVGDSWYYSFPSLLPWLWRVVGKTFPSALITGFSFQKLIPSWKPMKTCKRSILKVILY